MVHYGMWDWCIVAFVQQVYYFIVYCSVLHIWHDKRKQFIIWGNVIMNGIHFSINVMHAMTPPHGNVSLIIRPLLGKPRVTSRFRLQWACDLVAWTSRGVNSRVAGDVRRLDAHMTSLAWNVLLLMMISISRTVNIYNIIAAYELENTFHDSVLAIYFIH